MLNADQPTPKYDQLKKRFMKNIVKEDLIQELQLGLLRLGQDSTFVCSHYLAKGIRHGSSLEGAMNTMEFLDHCTNAHHNEMYQDELDPSELQVILESSHHNNLAHTPEQWDWPVNLLEELARTAKLTLQQTVMVVYMVIPADERCSRRLKWLLKTRMFHHIGTVSSVFIPEHDSVAQSGEKLALGYAFVVFEDAQAASAAATAAQNFPWPIKGQYNEEAGRFEGLRYHRWKTVLWSHLVDQCQHHVPYEEGNNAASTPKAIAGGSKADTPSAGDIAEPGAEVAVEALALKLQALHRRLDAVTIASSPSKAASKQPAVATATSGKQYSPAAKGKIAALLRKSVQEVRQSEPIDSTAVAATAISDITAKLSGIDPVLASQTYKSCLDTLQGTLKKVRAETCPSAEHAAITLNATNNRKKGILSYGEIDRHIEVCARSADLYEMVGWYQQKIRLLTQDFLGGAQEDTVRYGTSGIKSDSADSADSGSTAAAVTPHLWEDLQLFLDRIKCGVKESAQGGRRAHNEAEASVSGAETCHSATIMSMLNEIALLLMAAKSSAKSLYIERLQGTVDHQNDVLERSEERIEELRDKVREYGQEIAALEARSEEQRVALAYHRASGERLVAMERQKTELEREKADSDAKIARMQSYIDHLRETVASLEANRHRHSQLTETSQNRAHPSQSFLLATDSEESIEMEQKRKASGGPLSPRSSPGATRQSARKAAHDSAGAAELSPAALVRQLSRLSVSDWIGVYHPQNKGTLESIQDAEAKMAGVNADLDAALEKFRFARREMTLNFTVAKGNLLKAAKSAAAEKDEQNLCCICQEAVKSILLMPCRHLCVCQVCSEGPPVSGNPRSPRSQRPRMLQSCPVCRATITECLRVYA